MTVPRARDPFAGLIALFAGDQSAVYKAVNSSVPEAVAAVGDYHVFPHLDAPATPERILRAVEDVRSRAAAAGGG